MKNAEVIIQSTEVLKSACIQVRTKIKTYDDIDRLVHNNISTCRELATYGVSCGEVIKSIHAINLV